MTPGHTAPRARGQRVVLPSGLLPFRIRAALVLLCVGGPLGTELYLPALPVMTGELGTTAGRIQLTLTTFLLGLACGQAVIGPVSDRWGRRGPLLVAGVLATGVGVACALAGSTEMLIGFRFAQGFAGAAGLVISRAMITDLLTGAAATRQFSLQTAAIVLAPVAAPPLGAVVATLAGWRSVFGVLAGLALVATVAAAAVLPESLPPARRRGASGAPRVTVVTLVRRPGLMLDLGTHWCSFAVLLTMATASTFVLQTHLGLTPLGYAIAVGSNAAAFAVVARVNAGIVHRVGSRRLQAYGMAATLLGSLVLAVSALSWYPVELVLPAMFLVMAGLGFTLPTATALALGQAREAAGAGAALLGCGQYAVGAGASALVAAAGDATAPAMGLIMSAGASLAVLLAVLRSRIGAMTLPGDARLPT